MSKTSSSRYRFGDCWRHCLVVFPRIMTICTLLCGVHACHCLGHVLWKLPHHFTNSNKPLHSGVVYPHKSKDRSFAILDNIVVGKSNRFFFLTKYRLAYDIRILINCLQYNYVYWLLLFSIPMQIRIVQQKLVGSISFFCILVALEIIADIQTHLRLPFNLLALCPLFGLCLASLRIVNKLNLLRNRIKQV